MMSIFALLAFLVAIPVGGAALGQAPPDTVTAAQVARGDSVFRGKAGGGTCFVCHQPNAKGLPGLAPDLTDSKWIHIDGGLPAIWQTVLAGVPKPKQAAAPMLPMGGAKLSPGDVHAVAAYVWSLGQKK